MAALTFVSPLPVVIDRNTICSQGRLLMLLDPARESMASIYQESLQSDLICAMEMGLDVLERSVLGCLLQWKM